MNGDRRSRHNRRALTIQDHTQKALTIQGARQRMGAQATLFEALKLACQVLRFCALFKTLAFVGA